MNHIKYQPLLLLIFLLPVSPALANWTWLATTASYDVYADSVSIERKGSHTTMWVMLDFKKIQDQKRGSFHSSKLLREFDCAARRSRMIAIKEYQKRRGQGEEVNTFFVDLPWEGFQGGGALETQWQFACDRQ